MIELRIIDGEVLLPVQAQPGGKRDGIVGVHDGRLKVAVTQAPEKRKANKALTQVLAKELGVRRSQISLQSGETSAKKVFGIVGLSAEEVAERIESIVGV
ncbi:MAG: DUF167 domain-containing protein [Planctomycetota bacterium]|nr:MAG: DUF167 domain-containing protein [Planctomycetota bacterium]REJ90493.1 MAG: DUF167 domain-containing protein [Planctomycetota bacterium]REK20449.1 MAG: DUF167 domain-containing protein [Planctomycetota bacterium]REK29296.1 MAG: DUF167 domain-containing protein [Planctomycetota bacterium]